MGKNINSKREYNGHWLHWWINAKSWYHVPKDCYYIRKKKGAVKDSVKKKTNYRQRSSPKFSTEDLGESKRGNEGLPF